MKVRLKISIILILLTLLSTIVVFSIFLIVNLFSRNENISISTYSEENNTIKVLSYNINHGNGLSSEEQKKKLNSIAQYIKDNKIEIGGLQEVSTFQDPDIAIQLENELKAVGYPMNFVVPETLEEDYFKNIIISKYPIVDSEFIQKGSRWVVISQIQSPIGLIRFSSVHVHHGKGNCSAIKSTVNIMKKYQSDPMMIMVGDYNIGLFEPTCETKIGDHYDFSCEKGQPCESFDMIDWVFLTKNGNVLKQIYRSKDKNMKASDHLP
ncbi:endonuclease/exonuclease/phosphatase family protein, partial [Candidatus Dojkabacteria bacterium]|nr:endonuclease/exonuclease/phosphatase family protein [Candidatus Dojkabacteria bacterium]